MRRLAALFSCLALVAPLLAQTAPGERTLAQVQGAFAAQRDRLYAGEAPPTRQQELDLLGRQAGELAAFVAHEAAGDDRWHGRLLLAELRVQLRQREAAVAALRAIDPAAAPGLVLLTAADFAVRLQDKPLRDALVEHALARKAALPERLDIGRVLMTVLREIERGEQVFAQALAAAADDEQRAEIRWHHCHAWREREDLPENTWLDALETLGKELPGTRWGGVARDRAAASRFAPGSPANDFATTTVDGQRLELATLRGRAVLLAFCSALDRDSPALVTHLQGLAKQHAENLAVLAVAVDDDAKAAIAAFRQLGLTVPLVCDGRGWHTELALRYGIEGAPTLVAIDRRGAIAGLNLHLDTRDARDELEQALARALRPTPASR